MKMFQQEQTFTEWMEKMENLFKEIKDIKKNQKENLETGR